MKYWWRQSSPAQTWWQFLNPFLHDLHLFFSCLCSPLLPPGPLPSLPVRMKDLVPVHLSNYKLLSTSSSNNHDNDDDNNSSSIMLVYYEISSENTENTMKIAIKHMTFDNNNYFSKNNNVQQLSSNSAHSWLSYRQTSISSQWVNHSKM